MSTSSLPRPASPEATALGSTPLPGFDDPGLHARLLVLARLPGRLDDLAFGVIGFDDGNIVCHYNRHEAEQTGLMATRVFGQNVFTELAQCMNNFLVAERFAVARATGTALDDTIGYTLTWRMRPTPVRLRLMWIPGCGVGFLALARQP